MLTIDKELDLSSSSSSGGLNEDGGGSNAAAPPAQVVVQQVCKTTTRVGKGPPVGSKKWKELEVDSLLEIVEAKLPIRSKHWEDISFKLYKQFGFKRKKNACQNKFLQMANVDKPTRSSFIPRHVVCAKDIKEKIDAEEVVGLVACNDSTASKEADDNFSPQETVLHGSPLLGNDNNLQRPQTKKQKSNDKVGAMLHLASEQGKSLDTIVSALKSVPEAISGTSSDKIVSVKVKVDGMENTLMGLGSKLDNILEKLSN